MPTKPKIVLAFPKPKESKGKCIPVPLITLARMLDPKEYDVELINATTDDYKKKLAECGDEPLCFGISSMTGYQIHSGIEIANVIREYYPKAPIVWGGYHPSLFPEQTVQHRCVDMVVRGQGERTFQELVHCMAKGQSLEKVNGITFKNNGNVINTPERPYEDINNFPPLAYHLVENFKEFVVKSRYGKRNINYLSSQGCPNDCAFCCQPVVCKRKWTGLSAERVVSEIESLVNNYGVDAVSLLDSNFFVSKERVRKICEGLLNKKLDVSMADVNARVDLAYWSDDMWVLMRKAGIRHLFIGAESGSQKALDLIGKGVKVEDTLLMVEKCAQHDVDFQLSFMLGLPSMDIREEIETTLTLIDKAVDICKGRVGVNVIFWRYAPYPGSRLYYLSIDHGFKAPQSFEEWGDFGLWEEGFETPWVPKKYWKATRYLNYIRPYVTGNIKFDELISYERVLARLWKVVSNLRWKSRSFDFAVDYQILDFYHRLKERGVLPSK
jgi:radical SAM superfamily enzyme YgiQ (UPF0313 family)